MAQAMIKITDAKLSKNVVQTNESYKISVKVLALTPDTGTYRLPFKLGTERGTVK